MFIGLSKCVTERERGRFIYRSCARDRTRETAQGAKPRKERNCARSEMVPFAKPRNGRNGTIRETAQGAKPRKERSRADITSFPPQ